MLGSALWGGGGGGIYKPTCVPCEKGSSAIFMPLRINFCNIYGVRDTGPRAQMMPLLRAMIRQQTWRD